MSTHVKEREIETYLRQVAREMGGMALKFSSPGQRGVPDRIVVVPGIPPFFVEVKKPKGGVLGKQQMLMHQKIIAAGGHVALAYTKDDVDHIFDTARTFLDVKLALTQKD